MSEAVRIVGIETENFKRLKIVNIKPAPSGLTIIGGRNGQGKTSILDSIVSALAAARKIPTNLKRDGGMADPRVSIDLGDLIVERKGKNFDLHIKTKDGSRAGQKTLDGIIEEFALDLPLFMALKPAEKAKHLLRLIGVEDKLAAFDKEEQKFYDERHGIGILRDQKDAHAKQLAEYPNAPESLLTTDELMNRSRAIMQRNAARTQHRQNLTNLREQQAIHEKRVENARLALEQAEADLEGLKAKKALAELEPITDNESDAAIQEELSSMEATNAQVRANMDKSKAREDAETYRQKYNAYDIKIADVRNARNALLNSVSMPLPGLTVEKGELLYNGKAWDCMSTMEQYRVSVAIAHALKPSCAFVLLDRLETFDPENLRELDNWLAEMGIQGIATRVSTGKECSVIIEDGMVADAESQAITSDTQASTTELPDF